VPGGADLAGFGIARATSRGQNVIR